MAAVLFTAMTIGIIVGFATGDFWGEFMRILAMPWGVVSMMDLFTGFTLFSMWIIYREKAFLPAASGSRFP